MEALLLGTISIDFMQQMPECNKATRIGNALEDAAGKLDDLSALLERTGGATALAGVSGASVPLAIRGVDMMAVGGAAGLIADVGQEVGGIAQMIGGNASVGRANDISGSVSLLFGSLAAMAGEAIKIPGASVAARAFNSIMAKAFAAGGAVSDFVQGLSPGMAPARVWCN